MKKFIISITIFFMILIVADLIAQNLIKKSSTSSKSRYTIEETARILSSKKIGNLKLDHDDHVYKCISISKRAGNLEGAVDAIVAFKTRFGYTLDDNEVDLIIRISKLNTGLYEELASLSKAIGKKDTTINEHFNIVNVAEKGNVEYLKLGLNRAYACGYKMENDYYSTKRLQILINIGKVSPEDRFLDIYSAMRKVGMAKKINSRSLEILYKLSKLNGDVASRINGFLYMNKWKSRKQPGEREYSVIRDMMNENDRHYQMSDGAQQSSRSDFNSYEGEMGNKKIEEKKSSFKPVKKKSKWKAPKKSKRKSSKKRKWEAPKKVEKKSTLKKKVNKSCILQIKK